MELSIGDVAAKTGLTRRALRYYEDLGLLEPERDAGGRRRYDSDTVERLSRIRLLRDLGTPLGEVDLDGGPDLWTLTRHHLADLDERLASLARRRERVRAVEARLLAGDRPRDGELLDLLAGLGDEPGAVRRLTLLIYRDIEAVQRHLVDVFGFEPGDLSRDEDGRVVHGELFVGDGVIWMHQESAEFRLASPASTGSASHCMAVDVDDVDAHHGRSLAAGADVVYEPTDMPYGVREYAVRDPEGGLWSFMQPMEDR